ncbi:MAG TPA: CDP-alcohol phosphatidyltransferase family protein [Streptosporangiaceae bacterium]
MTLAVVLATEPVGGVGEEGGGPTAALPYGPDTTLLERLLDQLAALGVHDSRIVARRELAAPLHKNGHDVIETDDLADDLRVVAELARAAKEPVLILSGDIVAGDELLVRLVADSKAPASAVISRARSAGPPTRPVVRVSRARVVSAGSRYHQVTDPNAVFRGILRVAPPETKRLADAAAELAGLAGSLRPVPPIRTREQVGGEQLERFVDRDAEGDLDGSSSRKADWAPPPVLATTPSNGDDVPALLLTGLVRSGVRVGARGVRVLVCERALTPEQAAAARAAVEAVDEDRVRLDAAVKGDDGFFTTYAVSTYSWRIARWTARRRLTPNVVTSISMGVAVLAAVWFAAGTRAGMIVGAALLYVAFVLDCVDGQLARYTRQFSTLGAWLDATFDRAKEYVAYAGLAVGSTAAAIGSSVHGGDVWRLAVAAMAVQTCRHMIDFAFGAAKRRVAGGEQLPVLPLDAPDDSALDSPPQPPRAAGAPDRKGLGQTAIWLSNRTEKMPGLRWAKKIVILPIGERFALISLSAALFNAKVTFVVLLCWGLLAAGYTLTGRILRSIA